MYQTAEDQQLGSDLVSLGLEMESVRSLIDPEYKDIEKFVTPWLTPFQDNTGLPPARDPIYDNTAVKANRRMGNGLMGFTMSPTTRWFLMGLFDRYGAPLNSADIPGAAHWLRQVEDCLYGVFARSNFYPEGAQVTTLAGSHGSPTMWCDIPNYDGQAWSFTAMHPKSIWFSENDRREVDNHRRSLRLQNGDMVRRFGKYLGDEHQLVKDWKGAPNAWTNFFHQVFPNDEFDPNSLNTRKKKIQSVYFLPDGMILEAKGLDFDRYLTWRWQPGSDQVYSGSPAMDAMAGIKTLQHMRKSLIQVAQRHGEPAVNAPDSMRGKVKMGPRSINYYERPDQMIVPINTAGNYPVTFEDYKYEVNSVDDFFYGNLWLMLERQPASARLTAYQVSQMIGEKASVLGPVVANHQSEFADPLISLVFNVEMNAGRIPPVPASLRSYAGADGKGVRLIPHYIGPLAMAQRRNGIMDGFSTALNAMGPIWQIRQEAMDHVNFEKWTRIAMTSSGVPEEVINGMDEVVQIRKGRMQAAQQQQQQAMQMELAKNFKGLSTTPGAGSPGMALAKGMGINQPEQAAAV